MTLTVAQVRKLVEVALIEGGFHKSTYPAELFPFDADAFIPDSFAIGSPSTELEPYDGRERYGMQGGARTLIVVQTASRLRGDSDTDYESGLDREHDALKAVLTIDDPGVEIRPLAMSRTVTPTGEWLVSTLQFRVHHRFSFIAGQDY